MTAPYDARRRATRPELVPIFRDAPPPEPEQEDDVDAAQEQP